MTESEEKQIEEEASDGWTTISCRIRTDMAQTVQDIADSQNISTSRFLTNLIHETAYYFQLGSDLNYGFFPITVSGKGVLLIDSLDSDVAKILSTAFSGWMPTEPPKPL